MKKCSECSGLMKEMTGQTTEGVSYSYYQCRKCGEEILSREQLHTVATKYRVMKNYRVRLTRWGLSLGMRFPKEITEKYGLRDNEEVTIIPEEEGLKVIPA